MSKVVIAGSGSVVVSNKVPKKEVSKVEEVIGHEKKDNTPERISSEAQKDAIEISEKAQATVSLIKEKVVIPAMTPKVVAEKPKVENPNNEVQVNEGEERVDLEDEEPEGEVPEENQPLEGEVEKPEVVLGSTIADSETKEARTEKKVKQWTQEEIEQRQNDPYTKIVTKVSDKKFPVFGFRNSREKEFKKALGEFTGLRIKLKEVLKFSDNYKELLAVKQAVNDLMKKDKNVFYNYSHQFYEDIEAFIGEMDGFLSRELKVAGCKQILQKLDLEKLNPRYNGRAVINLLLEKCSEWVAGSKKGEKDFEEIIELCIDKFGDDAIAAPNFERFIPRNNEKLFAKYFEKLCKIVDKDPRGLNQQIISIISREIGVIEGFLKDKDPEKLKEEDAYKAKLAWLRVKPNIEVEEANSVVEGVRKEVEKELDKLEFDVKKIKTLVEQYVGKFRKDDFVKILAPVIRKKICEGECSDMGILQKHANDIDRKHVERKRQELKGLMEFLVDHNRRVGGDISAPIDSTGVTLLHLAALSPRDVMYAEKLDMLLKEGANLSKKAARVVAHIEGGYYDIRNQKYTHGKTVEIIDVTPLELVNEFIHEWKMHLRFKAGFIFDGHELMIKERFLRLKQLEENVSWDWDLNSLIFLSKNDEELLRFLDKGHSDFLERVVDFRKFFSYPFRSGDFTGKIKSDLASHSSEVESFKQSRQTQVEKLQKNLGRLELIQARIKSFIEDCDRKDDIADVGYLTFPHIYENIREYMESGDLKYIQKIQDDYQERNKRLNGWVDFIKPRKEIYGLFDNFFHLVDIGKRLINHAIAIEQAKAQGSDNKEAQSTSPAPSVLSHSGSSSKVAKKQGEGKEKVDVSKSEFLAEVIAKAQSGEARFLEDNKERIKQEFSLKEFYVALQDSRIINNPIVAPALVNLRDQAFEEVVNSKDDRRLRDFFGLGSSLERKDQVLMRKVIEDMIYNPKFSLIIQNNLLQVFDHVLLYLNKPKFLKEIAKKDFSGMPEIMDIVDKSGMPLSDVLNIRCQVLQVQIRDNSEHALDHIQKLRTRTDPVAKIILKTLDKLKEEQKDDQATLSSSQNADPIGRCIIAAVQEFERENLSSSRRPSMQSDMEPGHGISSRRPSTVSNASTMSTQPGRLVPSANTKHLENEGDKLERKTTTTSRSDASSEPSITSSSTSTSFTPTLAQQLTEMSDRKVKGNKTIRSA